MTDLHDQIIMITKASAFDILQDRIKELEAENGRLRDRVKYLLDLIEEYAAKIKAIASPKPAQS